MNVEAMTNQIHEVDDLILSLREKKSRLLGDRKAHVFKSAGIHNGDVVFSENGEEYILSLDECTVDENGGGSIWVAIIARPKRGGRLKQIRYLPVHQIEDCLKPGRSKLGGHGIGFRAAI